MAATGGQRRVESWQTPEPPRISLVETSPTGRGMQRTSWAYGVVFITALILISHVLIAYQAHLRYWVGGLVAVVLVSGLVHFLDPEVRVPT